MALGRIQWISACQCERAKGHTLRPGVRKLLNLELFAIEQALQLADLVDLAERNSMSSGFE